MNVQEVHLSQSQSLLTQSDIGVSRLRENIIALFEKEVRSTYPASGSHPYHNWEHHIPEVLDAALNLTSHLERLGVRVDRDVVTAAVLGHDAGYGYDHRALGFRSKEELAADLSERMLNQLGGDPIFCARVAGAIRATERGVELRSTEECILRAADLSGLAGDHKTFMSNSRLLHAEYQNARAERIDYLSFFRWQVDQVLSGYLAAMIKLTPDAQDESKRSMWHQGVVRNICQTDWQAAPVALLDQATIPTFVLENRQMTGNELLLASTTPDALNTRLEELRAFAGRNQVPALVVPGTTGGVSLPDSCCTEVHLTLKDSMADIYEAVRVARDGAMIQLYLTPAASALRALVVESVLSVSGVIGYSQCHQNEGWQILTFQVGKPGKNINAQQ